MGKKRVAIRFLCPSDWMRVTQLQTHGQSGQMEHLSNKIPFSSDSLSTCTAATGDNGASIYPQVNGSYLYDDEVGSKSLICIDKKPVLSSSTGLSPVGCWFLPMWLHIWLSRSKEMRKHTFVLIRSSHFNRKVDVNIIIEYYIVPWHNRGRIMTMGCSKLKAG